MNSQITYPGKTVIGSCSICGGPVLVHEAWFCTIPDVPTCANCGATKADSHGPVIPMAPATPCHHNADDGLFAEHRHSDMPDARLS